MNKKEKIIFTIIFGAVVPITMFLAAWWGSVGHIEEQDIFKYALIGFILGLAIDQLFLKKFISDFYRVPTWLSIVIYIFYSICIFGFFMGVPVFNLILGYFAGCYMAGRVKTLAYQQNTIKKITQSTSIFTCCVMFIVCVTSAIIALRDPYTAANIEGMLNLHFQLSIFQLLSIIVLGGTGLVIGQYYITNWTIHYYLKQTK